MKYSYDIGSLLTVSPATEEPVSLSEAKLWIKVDEDQVQEDGLLGSLIAMARARYENFTGRSLLKQTYDWYLDCLPNGPDQALRPSRWPLVSIGSIRMFGTTDGSDTGGVTMSAANYYVDVASEPGRIVPVSGASWLPATRQINACIVRFTAGHSTSSTSLPDNAKTQVLRMIAAGYEHRGDEQEMGSAMDAVLRDDDLDLPEWG